MIPIYIHIVLMSKVSQGCQHSGTCGLTGQTFPPVPGQLSLSFPVLLSFPLRFPETLLFYSVAFLSLPDLPTRVCFALPSHLDFPSLSVYLFHLGGIGARPQLSSWLYQCAALSNCSLRDLAISSILVELVFVLLTNVWGGWRKPPAASSCPACLESLPG